MKKKLLLLSILIAGIAQSAVVVAQTTAKVGNFSYEFNATTKTGTVVKHANEADNTSLYTGAITIPDKETYNGVEYTVTEIGRNAFYNTTVTEVVLPNTLLTIGEQAFWNCKSLTKVTLGSSLKTIGDNAFSECSKLTSAVDNLPSSLTTIGKYAFYNCESLKGGLDLSNVTSLGTYVFQGCSNLDGTLVLCDDIVTIPEHCFYACNNLKYDMSTLPTTVAVIGDAAFAYCNTMTGTPRFTEGVLITIGQQAFLACSGLSGNLVFPPFTENA